jgi:excisionase family DNA binding protein
MLAKNANPNLQDALLTVAEVAELLRVPVSWVYERTRRRGLERIPHLKLGKYLRFHASEVREWLYRLRES